MASSNIKLFDENKGNMLTDTEFNISTQRLNGLQTGVASSQLQNKAMYQASLVAYAIAQVMMQNGLNANDTDAVSAFVANLSGTMLQKVYDIATTAEAQAGVATGKWMSPALTKVLFDYRKATTSEAQNATDDTKWMSPIKVWNLLVAKKCTAEDIYKYALLSMSRDSGTLATITPTSSGHVGLLPQENTSTATLTIPLSSIPSGARVGFFEGVSSTFRNTSGSGGTLTFSWVMTVKFKNTTVQIAAGDGTRSTNFNTEFNSYLENLLYNIYGGVGTYLVNTDSIVVTITSTRTSGDGYYDGKITGTNAKVRYIPT